MDNQSEKNNESSWLHHNAAPVLAIITVISSFCLFFAMLLLELRPENEKIIVYILGVLSAIDTQIFSYYFGSSHGSLEKDKRSRKFAPSPPMPPSNVR